MLVPARDAVSYDHAIVAAAAGAEVFEQAHGALILIARGLPSLRPGAARWPAGVAFEHRGLRGGGV